MRISFYCSRLNYKPEFICIQIWVLKLLHSYPKGDLWVQSPVIIIGNIRSIAENRRQSTEAYSRVMSTWPSMMVGTAKGDLPKLFSPALLA